jgi:hypothetical protein
LLQLTNSWAGGHLTPTSYSSHCCLKTLSSSQLLLVICLGTDRAENTASNSYSIVAHVCCGRYISAAVYTAIT